MSAKRRNELRRYRSGVAEKIGIGLLAFGFLQPLFGNSELSVWLSLIAVLASAGFLWTGDYVLRGLEEE